MSTAASSAPWTAMEPLTERASARANSRNETTTRSRGRRFIAADRAESPSGPSRERRA